ncbi:probable ATP-dependent DNA helicase HFM1 [Teleopsis dalmanni]|uniref:probable ATP-dependent DNA helicase HFM1 n=1 Tax=Teleopsis dalmanni TaxID=139649 RepID=UPI0018CE9AD8|nr:probable ATP-dependent DNA helicase HFM1 [Teleopsis dalmanni]
MAAAVLEKDKNLFLQSFTQKNVLINLSSSLHDSKLRKYFILGIGFHHAGLTLEDRILVEDCFRNRLIMVLLCTNTLAMGVNLPAHLVVIKSTEFYCRGKLEEYSESTLLQMIGRAGRPQYDNKGVAVILTHNKNVVSLLKLFEDRKVY